MEGVDYHEETSTHLLLVHSKPLYKSNCWNILDPLVHSDGDIEDLSKTRDEIEKKVIDLLKGMNVPL